MDPRNQPINQKLQTHIDKYNSQTTLTTANSMPSFAHINADVETKYNYNKK